MLHLLGEFVLAWEESGELPEQVSIDPVAPLPGVVEPHVINDRRFGSDNMPVDWEMTHPWDLLKWQSLSYRPAVPVRSM